MGALEVHAVDDSIERLEQRQERAEVLDLGRRLSSDVAEAEVNGPGGRFGDRSERKSKPARDIFDRSRAFRCENRLGRSVDLDLAGAGLDHVEHLALDDPRQVLEL